MRNRYRFVFLSILFIANTVLANNYYFSSSSGSDSYTNAQAQNAATPWKTLTKLNTILANLQPSDTIFFKRGDVFKGSIKITQSGVVGNPIVFSAYGSGDKPIISGLETFEKWNNVGSGIWENSCTNCNNNVNILLFNGINKAMGRYPNSNSQNGGYLTFESHKNKSQITDNELNTSINWTGGELVLRTQRWVIDRDSITNHSGNTIFYNTTSKYEPKDNFGYFIQNHIKTLDVMGEWFYDAKNSKMNCFFGSDSPASYTVKASVINTIVTVNNQKNITFNNISFKGSNKRTFYISNAKNISILNCDILFSGINGIDAVNSSDIIIENNNILNTNNKALNLVSCNNSKVRNNLIKNTGVQSGMGLGTDNSYSAVDINGDNNLVEFNKIDSIGYIPVLFEGNKVLIKNNYINNFCFVKDDGGGIYTWEGNSTNTHNNRTINGNIIDNGIGAPEGTDELNERYAYGIYMDDNTDHVEVINNSISNCRAGYLNHNSNSITFKYNTLFNNATQVDFSKNANGSCSDCAVENNIVKNNILFSKKPYQLILLINSPDDIKNFGDFDNNYYSRPFNEGAIIQTNFTPTGSSIKINETLNLEDWQSTYKKDLNSKKGPVSFPYYKVNKILSQNKVTNGTFDTKISNIYCDSPLNNCSVKWSDGPLDGGTLKFSFPSNSNAQNRSNLVIDVGNLETTKNYILKFSAVGAKQDKNIDVFLKQNQNPHTKLTITKSFKTTKNRKEYESLFAKPFLTTEASIHFFIDEQDGTVWFDNFEFYEADVTIADMDKFIIYKYNETQSPITLNLSGSFVDSKGAKYQDTVTLQPYTSVVLMKSDSTIIKEDPPNNPKSEDLKIYPNPSLGEFNVAWNNEIKGFKLRIVDILGRNIKNQIITSNKAVVDTSIWVPGIYFCIVNNGKKRIVKKVIVN